MVAAQGEGTPAGRKLGKRRLWMVLTRSWTAYPMPATEIDTANVPNHIYEYIQAVRQVVRSLKVVPSTYRVI